jgi:hypothetical protein
MDRQQMREYEAEQRRREMAAEGREERTMSLSDTTVTVPWPRPTDIPRDWRVFVAHRPLLGHRKWIGEWSYGTIYAAIDPADTYDLGNGHGTIAESWERANRRDDARLVIFAGEGE